MLLRTTFLGVVAWAALALASANAADAKQVKFVGVHPIAADFGGGFCYIEAAHIHVYQPPKAEVLYREHDDAFYFVGDPVPYGYDGPKHAYYGAHPVPVDVVLEEEDLDGDEVEYCYLDGPHYHYYVPPPTVRFTVKGGVYWYVGDFPREYERDKPRFAKINVVYKPLRYARPVVVVAPPPEYHGVIVEVDEPVVEVHGPRAHLEGEAGVGIGVGVEVVVPAPTIELRIGGPAVIVEERDHRHHDNGKHKGHWKKKKHKGRW